MLLEMAGPSLDVDVIPEFEFGCRSFFAYPLFSTSLYNGLSMLTSEGQSRKIKENNFEGHGPTPRTDDPS